MKIEPLACILMLVCEMNFELPEMAKIKFSGPTCVSSGYFIHILYVNVVLEKFQWQLWLFWIKMNQYH